MKNPGFFKLIIVTIMSRNIWKRRQLLTKKGHGLTLQLLKETSSGEKIFVSVHWNGGFNRIL